MVIAALRWLWSRVVEVEILFSCLLKDVVYLRRRILGCCLHEGSLCWNHLVVSCASWLNRLASLPRINVEAMSEI